MRMRIGRTFFALAIAAPLIAVVAPSRPQRDRSNTSV